MNLEVESLQIVIAGAATLLSAVGALLAKVMANAHSTQKEANDSQKEYMKMFVDFAKDRGSTGANGGQHAETRQMIREMKESFNSFGEKLDTMIENQEKNHKAMSRMADAVCPIKADANGRT